MWSHEALRLIERLPLYWEVDAMIDPPRVRSAVHAYSVRAKEEAAEQQVMSLSDLAAIGIDVQEV